MSNKFDEELAKKIEAGNAFAKSDARLPLNLRKSKVEVTTLVPDIAIVGGQKVTKNDVYDKNLLLLSMAKMILLKQAQKVADGDPNALDKISAEICDTQEIIDKQIALSDGRGLVMDAEVMAGVPDYSFQNVFDAQVKSQAAEEVGELLKACGVEVLGNNKPGAVVKEKEKFNKKGLVGEQPKESSKSSDHKLGAFKTKEEEEMDKKDPSKIKGKKGQVAVATVSTKKAGLPDKADGTKKVSGDKAIQMKGACKLYIDGKFADKQIKQVPKGAKMTDKMGNVPQKGVDAKASGVKAMKADVKKSLSIEEESAEFTKSMEESQKRLNRPSLAPKAKQV